MNPKIYFFQGFGDRLLSEIKKLAPKNMKLKVNKDYIYFGKIVYTQPLKDIGFYVFFKSIIVGWENLKKMLL